MICKYFHKNTFSKIRWDVWVCLLIVIVTLVTYWQVIDHEFVFDDLAYITENSRVQEGLKTENITWAFTSTDVANWHPLTWLSHLLDIQIYGMNPGGHHLTNVFFHIVNTVLLFFVLRQMTGNLWRSGFVAGLFALHPLHVESVVWVSERKDVLSTFFWMLTIICYIRYIKLPDIYRYLLVIFFFISGLLSKPMLVTLPFVLLLLDFWPLKRLNIENYQLSSKGFRPLIFLLRSSVFLEKIPLFLLSAASSVITFIVQQRFGAVTSLQLFTINARISNALVSYVSYMGKMLWPFKLACYYPHPDMPPWWKIAGACTLLVSICVFVVRYAKSHPYLIVGWLWYMGTLVPVIGLVQVGEQAMADRYTYIPLIGIFVIIAWGIPDIFKKWHYKKIGLATISTITLSFLTIVSCLQIRHWRNDVTLFTHAINVTSKNSLAHYNLGIALEKEGRTSEAMANYYKALKIKPNYSDARNNLGLILAKKGETSEAIQHFSEILRLNPGYVKAHINLGKLMIEEGMTANAINHFSEVLRIDYRSVAAHNNLGVAFAHRGDIEAAVHYFQEALRNKPNYTEAKKNIKKILGPGGIVDASIREVQDKLKLNQDDAILHQRLGNLYKIKREYDKAIEEYQRALSIQTEFAQVLNSLSIVYAMKGEYEKGLSLLKTLVKREMDIPETYYLVASIYARQGNVEKSIYWLKLAVKKGYDNWQRIKIDSNLENVRALPEYEMLIKGH